MKEPIELHQVAIKDADVLDVERPVVESLALVNTDIGLSGKLLGSSLALELVK